MADLKERLRDLDRIHVPRLDDELSRPRLPSRSEVRTIRRLVTVGVALAVAAGGFAVAIRAFDGDQAPADDPDSTLLATPKANGSIYLRIGGRDGGSRIEAVEPDGTGRRVVFQAESMRVTQLAWSPDGSRIAYRNPIAGERGIYVANADGTDVVRLTDGVNDGWPSWSPDGTRIVFSSSAYDATIEHCDGLPGQEFLCPTDVYTIGADGSDVERLTSDEAAEFQPAWSPTGQRIAFVRAVGGSGGEAPLIFAMDADGSEPRQVSQLAGGFSGSDYAPAWSPDGSQIAFVGHRWEDGAIWVVNADGASEHQIADALGSGANRVAWSPDGSHIAYACVPEGADEAALCLISPDGSRLQSIAQIPWDAADIAWQPLAPPAPAPDAIAVDSIQVADDVRSVAYGEGSIWVAADDDDGTFPGRIVRIDPATMEVLAEIPVDGLPTWEVGGGGLLVADGSVWMTGSAAEPGSERGSRALLIRIDPLTNSVVEQIDLGAGHGADVALDEGGIWVLMNGAEGTMEVVGVDPVSGQLTARIELQSSWAHFMVAAGGRLWVNERFGSSALTIIDPVAAQVIASIPAPEWSDSQSETLTAGAGFVWAGFMNGTMGAIDPATGTFPIRPIDVPGMQFAAVFSGDALWYVGYDQSEAGNFVARYFPATGETDVVVPLGNDPARVALAVGPESVWVLGYNGSLTRVSLG